MSAHTLPQQETVFEVYVLQNTYFVLELHALSDRWMDGTQGRYTHHTTHVHGPCRRAVDTPREHGYIILDTHVHGSRFTLPVKTGRVHGPRSCACEHSTHVDGLC